MVGFPYDIQCLCATSCNFNGSQGAWDTCEWKWWSLYLSFKEKQEMRWMDGHACYEYDTIFFGRNSLQIRFFHEFNFAFAAVTRCLWLYVVFSDKTLYLNNALHPLELETLRSFEGGREGRSFVTCIGVTFYMVKIRGIIFLVLMIQKLEWATVRYTTWLVITNF